MENQGLKDDRTQASELEDEDFYESEFTPKEPGMQLVFFRLSHEWYAVEISEVIEVIQVDQLTDLPSAPPHIAGISNLHGNIISVTDLKKLFGLAPAKLAAKSRIIVVSSKGMETGLLVDEISGIKEIGLSQIDPPLSTLPVEKGQYLKGEIRIEGQLGSLLDTATILDRTRSKLEGCS